MEADVFFNDGQNNQPLGFFSTEDEKIFLTVEKADSKENFSTDGVWIIDQYTDVASPYWSVSTSGFYIPSISSSIPGDAVKVDIERYKELLKQQANGAEIVTDVDGQPTTVGRSVAQITGLQHDLLETNADTLGHMRVGVGLTVDPGGVVNIAPASANGIGGVQIGNGLAVDDMGKLTLSGDSALPGYTAEDKEKILAVKADGSGLNWATSENILNSSPVKYVSGVGHYKDETGWHTIEPAGKVIFSLCNTVLGPAPAGTLKCNGKKIKTRDYPELYKALTYNAITEETPEEFSLPNFSNKYLFTISSGVGVYSKDNDSYVTGGSAQITLTQNNLPAHYHNISQTTLQHRHPLQLETEFAGAHSHSVSAYKTSKNGTNDPVTILEWQGKSPNTTKPTTVANAHKHQISGRTSVASWDNIALPTDSAGKDNPTAIPLYPEYIAVQAFIYTGKVLIND